MPASRRKRPSNVSTETLDSSHQQPTAEHTHALDVKKKLLEKRFEVIKVEEKIKAGKRNVLATVIATKSSSKQYSNKMSNLEVIDLA